METIPQAMPNMVRNVRSLFAHRVRSTSPMRSRRTIVDWTRQPAECKPGRAARSLFQDTNLRPLLLHDRALEGPGPGISRARVFPCIWSLPRAQADAPVARKFVA